MLVNIKNGIGSGTLDISEGQMISVSVVSGIKSDARITMQFEPNPLVAWLAKADGTPNTFDACDSTSFTVSMDKSINGVLDVVVVNPE